MTRRKAVFDEAMVTTAEAAEQANSYAILSAQIALIEAERKARKAEIDRDCDERIGPRSDQLKGMFKRLQKWWESGGSEVAGKLRSTEFGGLLIGVRTPPPSLKLPKGQTAATIVGFLRDMGGLTEWLRVKTELNKDVIIEQLKGATRSGEDLSNLGFTLSQKDEFFIDVPKKAPEAFVAEQLS